MIWIAARRERGLYLYTYHMGKGYREFSLQGEGEKIIFTVLSWKIKPTSGISRLEKNSCSLKSSALRLVSRLKVSNQRIWVHAVQQRIVKCSKPYRFKNDAHVQGPCWFKQMWSSSQYFFCKISCFVNTKAPQKVKGVEYFLHHSSFHNQIDVSERAVISSDTWCHKLHQQSKT